MLELVDKDVPQHGFSLVTEFLGQDSNKPLRGI